LPRADESDKDAEGRALNTAWRPTFINGSSNPGGAAGTRLDPAYLEGVDCGPPLGVKGIRPALLDFQAWGKRFAGTPSEEPYITALALDVQGRCPESSNAPPDGDLRVFRADAPAGITVVNYPLMDVKASASIMRIDPRTPPRWTPIAGRWAPWPALSAPSKTSGGTGAVSRSSCGGRGTSTLTG